MIAGGPLVAGELVTGPEPDWTLLAMFRLFSCSCSNPAVTPTWILEMNGKIYVPCGYMDSTVAACGTLADRSRTGRTRNPAD